MSGFTFERREIKYRITAAQRAALEAAVGTRMSPDEHGDSTICNIYYDTPDYRLIRASLGEHGQIGREIEYFAAFYAPLLPAVHLSYERRAWFSREEPDLRITFDKNIRFRREDVSLTLPAGGQRILPESESLLEIKTAQSLPLWLAAQLDALGIFRSTFSKYGEAYKAILIEAQNTSGGKTA